MTVIRALSIEPKPDMSISLSSTAIPVFRMIMYNIGFSG